MKCAATMLVLPFCCLVFTAQEGLARRSRVVPEILVQAKVVVVDAPERGWIQAQLEIQHVYVGPAEVKGARFSVRTTKSGQGSNMLHPAPKENEVGIWALRKNKGGELVTGFSLTFLYRGLPLPSRLGVSPRYEQTSILAERIEKITTAPAEERWAMAQGYTRDPVAEVAAWAVHFAGELGGPQVIEFIRELAQDETLGIAVQVSIDEVLFKIDPDWGQSKERWEMFNRWVTKDYSDDPYVGRIRNRLDLASQHGGLDGALLWILLERAFKAKTLPALVLRECGWLIGTATERSKDAGAIYDRLVKFITESNSHDMRLACARALKNYIALTPEWIEELKGILEGMKDQEVKEVLSSAIKKAENGGLPRSAH